MVIKIGTCGWSRLHQAVPPSERRGRSTLQAYAERYPVVEVNSSFYRFHRVGTYRRWREEAPPSFEFTLKCHRIVSHEERLRPTAKALKALGEVAEGGEALGARVLLIQTPSSLKAEERVLRDADAFFDVSEADGLPLAWETRGESWEEPGARERLAEVLERHGIVHVTDPLKLDPVSTTDIAYFRLHGLPGYNLRYTYANRSLRRLHELLKAHERKVETVYIFFNNYAMYRDAERFQALVGTGRLPPSPFGPRSVEYALRAFEDWPATRTRLLERCGGWRCWVAPDRGVKLEQILRHLGAGEYRDLGAVREEAERIWRRTGFPTAEEAEEASELLGRKEMG